MREYFWHETVGPQISENWPRTSKGYGSAATSDGKLIILSSTSKTSLFGLFPDGKTFVKKVEILDWLFIITLRYLNLFFTNMWKFCAKFI